LAAKGPVDPVPRVPDDLTLRVGASEVEVMQMYAIASPSYGPPPMTAADWIALAAIVAFFVLLATVRPWFGHRLHST